MTLLVYVNLVHETGCAQCLLRVPYIDCSMLVGRKQNALLFFGPEQYRLDRRLPLLIHVGRF